MTTSLTCCDPGCCLDCGHDWARNRRFDERQAAFKVDQLARTMEQVLMEDDE